MDSQKSGRGKSPVGRKETNKGTGGQGGKGIPSQIISKGGSTVGRPGQPVERSGTRDEDPSRGVQARGKGRQGRVGTSHTQGTRGLDSGRRAQATPTVPPHPVRRGNLITGEDIRIGPMVHARAQNTLTPVAALTPNCPPPPPVTTAVKMNNDDDQAPHKLFNTIRHLTGRVLSPVEWGQWCQGLDKWTAGLSQWAFDREKSTSPQQAWSWR